jgi:hypothetical protein
MLKYRLILHRKNALYSSTRYADMNKSFGPARGTKMHAKGSMMQAWIQPSSEW